LRVYSSAVQIEEVDPRFKKTFLFMVYDDLIKNKEKAEVLGSAPGSIILQDLIGK